MAHQNMCIASAVAFGQKYLSEKDLTEVFMSVYDTIAIKVVEKSKKEKAEEIAKKMLSNNEDISKITDYTGLSEKEIISLKEDN